MSICAVTLCAFTVSAASATLEWESLAPLKMPKQPVRKGATRQERALYSRPATPVTEDSDRQWPISRGREHPLALLGEGWPACYPLSIQIEPLSTATARISWTALRIGALQTESDSESGQP